MKKLKEMINEAMQAQAGFQDFAHEVEGDDQLRPTK